MTAQGGFGGAGIGGDFQGTVTDVTINGGSVEATGGASAVAIGGGYGEQGSGAPADLTLYKTAKVTAGGSKSEAVTVPAVDRVDKCREQYAKIKPCEGHTYEKGACKWCGEKANDFTVSFADPASYTYDGTDKTPAVTVRDGAQDLTEDNDYTVMLEKKDVSGQYTAVNGAKDAGDYITIQSVRKGFHLSDAPIV